MSLETCQIHTHIYIDSQLTNDDSNDKVLKTLSNLHPAFDQKTFTESSRDENSHDVNSSSYE